MKTVFSNREIAHVFASNTQEHGRTSNGSMFFNSTTIYSYGYHFPIAKRVIKEGREYMLFTTRSYSNTTAKHIIYVRRAINHIKTVYCLNPEGTTESNFAHWFGVIQGQNQYLKKARKPEKYLSVIDRAIAQAKEFAEFMGVELPAEISEVSEASLQGLTSEKITEIEVAKQARIVAEREAQQAEALKRHKEEVAKWRAFKSDTMYSRYGAVDYLRFNAEKQRIQTSQGIEIPLAIAKDLFTYIMETVAKGGCTECNKTVLDRYQVRSISDRDVKIGCHTILISEIKKVAKAAGIS